MKSSKMSKGRNASKKVGDHCFELNHWFNSITNPRAAVK